MQLNDNDIHKWILVLQNRPVNIADLLDWVKTWLRDFFPFERALLLYGENRMGQIEILHMLEHGHSQDYLKQLNRNFEIASRGAFDHWTRTREPLLLDPDVPPSCVTNFEIEEILNNGLGRIAAHGQIDLKSRSGTFLVLRVYRRNSQIGMCRHCGLLHQY